jgi:hypothetical protein
MVFKQLARITFVLVASDLTACAQAALQSAPDAQVFEPDATQAPTTAPGDADHDECASDDDCQGLAAQCEPRDHVCLVQCPSLEIATRDDLTQARHCREIDGDLRFSTTELDAIDLPYLERITGNFLSIGGQPIREIELPALREVGTDQGDNLIELSLDASHLQHVSFPKLHRVHGSLSLFGLYSLTTLELPELESVDRMLSLVNLPRLTSLVLPPSVRAGETLDFEYLCALPADTIAADSDTSTHKAIGCCTESSLECDTLLCKCM